MTATQESAESAPLEIVPGQMEGEKRKENAAVRSAPMARPPFCCDRRAEGCAKRTRPAEAAIDRVDRVIEVAETGGETEKMMDAPTVMIDRIMPVYKVVETSIGVAVRGDEEAPLDGKGGCTKAMERARAMYPVKRWYASACIVKPARSARRHRARAPRVANRAAGRAWVCEQVNPEAMATRMTRPTLVPPS